jgi:CheY-like chemotaxis protein
MATILVVDDNITIRLMLKGILEEAGYEVLLAADGKEALAVYNEYAPDLILTDLVMPEKEGLETIMELRRKMLSEVKIIAMSGGIAGYPDSLSTARMLGADAVIAKPFDRNGVLRIIRSLLER